QPEAQMNPLKWLRKLVATEIALQLVAHRPTDREFMATTLGGLVAISVSKLRAEILGRTVPCAWCGVMLDTTHTHPKGGAMFEKKHEGKPVRVPACAWCKATAKQFGWKPVAAETPAPDPVAVKQEETVQ